MFFLGVLFHKMLGSEPGPESIPALLSSIDTVLLSPSGFRLLIPWSSVTEGLTPIFVLLLLFVVEADGASTLVVDGWMDWERASNDGLTQLGMVGIGAIGAIGAGAGLLIVMEETLGFLGAD